MSSKIQKAILGSDKTPLKLGTIEIPCYVLEDGTRVISGRGVQRAIGYEGASGDWLKKFVSTSKMFSDEIVAGFSDPIKFHRVDAGGSQPITYGYEATLLIDLCTTLIDQKKAGVLKERYHVYADFGEIIIRAVAKVGIIALIDEATGYQEIRGREELQKFLDKFLAPEYAKWAKRFPNDYFKYMFQMKGWTWNEASSKRPGVVGKYINDQIYSRVAPGVLEELKKRNPPDEKGNRKVRHHQWLSQDIGHPKLQEHFTGVIALQRASGNNWNVFQRLLNRSFPKYGANLMFDFPDDDSIPV